MLIIKSQFFIPPKLKYTGVWVVATLLMLNIVKHVFQYLICCHKTMKILTWKNIKAVGAYEN